jgi:GntR family transcriptional regulator, transcriptional repressor for pyruvate dehydrogenase complex
MSQAPLRPLQALADLVEQNISNGAWAPGMKLPTERELERQFGVPRNKLRTVLKRFEAAGKITRQIGRGSFVAGAPPRFSVNHQCPAVASTPKMPNLCDGSLSDLADWLHGASPHDILEVRMMVEPGAAELAALRATTHDLIMIEHCRGTASQAHTLKEFDFWGGRLQLEIIRAAKNDLLTLLYETVDEARTNLTIDLSKDAGSSGGRRVTFRDQRRSLVRALVTRDPKSARQLAQDHLHAVRRTFFGE